MPKKYTQLQEYINKTCKELGVKKEVLVHNNLHDVPDEYRCLHMLINALNEVKRAYETENHDFMKAFSYFSYEHRKGRLSTPEFLEKFQNYSQTKREPSLAIA